MFDSWYLFPRLRLAVGAAPKTGCTTVLSYLDALEHANTVPSLREFPTSRIPEDLIHDRVGRYRLGNDASSARGFAKIAVIRQPLERLVSAWTDKVLSWSSASLGYAKEPWFPRAVDSSVDLSTAFTDFLAALEDKTLRESDAHWSPVSAQYTRLTPDRWLRTDDVSSLPMVLGELGLIPIEWKGSLLPTLNASGRYVSKGLLDAATGITLPSAYEMDNETYNHAPHLGRRIDDDVQRIDLTNDAAVRAWVQELRLRKLVSLMGRLATFEEMQRLVNEVTVRLENREREYANAQLQISDLRRQVASLEAERFDLKRRRRFLR